MKTVCMVCLAQLSKMQHSGDYIFFYFTGPVEDPHRGDRPGGLVRHPPR